MGKESGKEGGREGGRTAGRRGRKLEAGEENQWKWRFGRRKVRKASGDGGRGRGGTAGKLHGLAESDEPEKKSKEEGLRRRKDQSAQESKGRSAAHLAVPSFQRSTTCTVRLLTAAATNAEPDPRHFRRPWCWYAWQGPSALHLSCLGFSRLVGRRKKRWSKREQAGRCRRGDEGEKRRSVPRRLYASFKGL